MTCREFNDKWSNYLENDYGGLSIEHPQVIEYLDHEFTEETKNNPSFRYAQIKIKFGSCRVYANSDKSSAWEKKINQLIDIKPITTMNDQEKIELLKDCFEGVIWMAIRYAHGKHTYAPHVVRAAVNAYKGMFPSWKLKQDNTINPPTWEELSTFNIRGDYLDDLFEDQKEAPTKTEPDEMWTNDEYNILKKIWGKSGDDNESTQNQ